MHWNICYRVQTSRVAQTCESPILQSSAGSALHAAHRSSQQKLEAQQGTHASGWDTPQHFSYVYRTTATERQPAMNVCTILPYVYIYIHISIHS